MRSIIVIAHDIRSTYNVGSLLRTAEGLGVEKVYLTGYTPYPQLINDIRLPHISQKLHASIHKTALGAEDQIKWEQSDDILSVIDQLHKDGYKIYALEQTESAIDISSFAAANKCALLLGSEVSGVSEDILKIVDNHLIIPMFGQKESF